VDGALTPSLPHVHRHASRSRFWPAVIDRVLRRPVLSCVLSAGLLVLLALTALGMRVSKPGDEALSARSEPELATFARVRAAFPSTSEPAIVVMAGPADQRAAA